MNDKNEKPVKLDPEKLGIPPRKDAVMGMIEMPLRIYRKIGEINSSRPLWVKIFSIFLALIALVLPGAFFIFMAFDDGLNLDNNNFQNLITLFYGLLLSGVGIKIIYSNTKLIFKNSKKKL